MKKYLVKIVSTATASNENFKGRVHTYYHGKENTLVACEGDPYIIIGEHLAAYYTKEYGYDRKCDAAKNWSYNHPENTEHWTSTAEIIEVEI